MEAITLCGLVIVMFGLWVEFEPAVRPVVKMIRSSRLLADILSTPGGRKPAYGRRMPICLAKGLGT